MMYERHMEYYLSISILPPLLSHIFYGVTEFVFSKHVKVNMR
jgi:hypothetical protein